MEIPAPLNKIEALEEFFIHNPAEYSKGYFESLNKEDCQTYLSPILYEANLIWFKHSNQYGLKSSPWTIPGFDFTNLINQYCIFNMIINGKKSKKNNINEINISESNSLELVNWDIFNSSISKNLEILFNKFVIDKLNEFKYKVNQYKSNMINIKKVRKAEKLLGNIYSGFILSVQTYGFFVEISELNVEGLVHVSTLNNDWYEYRSRQNLLIGRKSKKSYKVGDAIEVKIIKVDILKYQIDLELT